MESEIVHHLLDLNQQFYQNFAGQFSTTRQRIQPGVRRILDQVPVDAALLDLGCGNGGVARALLKGGYQGKYHGLDFSAGMLDLAQLKLLEAIELATVDRQDVEGRFQFQQANLATYDWHQILIGSSFDIILAFAVIHHLPGSMLRNNFIQQLKQIINPQGLFIHSEWQFLSSSKLRERIQPWETIGLTSSQVDPGDFLLDWRYGGQGLRYVHHFSETELDLLARDHGFQIQDTFLSDGEGQRLGLYQVWILQ